MQKYAELQAQIAELQKQAQEILSKERVAVIEDIKTKIAQFQFTAAELGLDKKQKKGASTIPTTPATT